MLSDHIDDDLQTTEKTIVESLPTRKQAITAVATAKVGHYHGDKMMDKHLMIGNRVRLP